MLILGDGVYLVFRLLSPPLVICNRIITVIRIRVVELKLDLDEKALLSVVLCINNKLRFRVRERVRPL